MRYYNCFYICGNTVLGGNNVFEEVKGERLWGIYSYSNFYRDYRYLQDDKTVLKNPHKGWYWHFIDNGLSSLKYRDNIGDDTMLDFPCLNHLYLRFDWGDIEKQEGVFDWSYIDSVMDKWGKLGYTFSLRICCYETGMKYATPEWVKDAGANGYTCSCNCWQPDYNDAIFLDKLENFLKECSYKFNNNPLVEYVDVGTYGTWGEGHLGYGSERWFGTDVLIKHINLHLKYFPKKYVLVNDHMINCSVNENGTRRRELLNYCIGKGMGIRDDSILCPFYTKGKGIGYDTIYTPFMFEAFYSQAPTDIEIDHYTNIDDDEFKTGLPLIECLKRVHATYCGFHGYPRPWLEKNKHLTEYLANRLGYWYFLDAIDLPDCVSGLPTVAEFVFTNKGFCHAYYPYDFKVRLKNETGIYDIGCFNGINKEIEAESSKSFKLNLDFSKVPEGEYELQIGMFEEERPILLGFRDICKTDDGYYLIDSLDVKKQL